MSLDVRIAKTNNKGEYLDTIWWGNITHNMNMMATHVPIKYSDEESMVSFVGSLYDVVWNLEEIGDGYFVDTTNMGKALSLGICYMIKHRMELLQYNPENGWGDYDKFLIFLIDYKNNCEDNPNCKIEISK